MDRKQQILKIYVEIVKQKRMGATRQDLLSKGITRDMYRTHFGTLDKLREAARISNPAVFESLIDEKIFTPKAIKALKGDVKKYSKYVITTAVTGMSVHKAFYKNLQYYCKQNNALLLILTSSDPAAMGGFELDGVLAGEHIVFDDLALNSNLFISAFKTSAKQTNPLTGARRIGQRERSMIVASPKQFLEYVPTANDKYPHALMTTGALTLPQYRSERYMSQRTAYIAEFDHKIGAVIVDIKDDKNFQFTQIQAEYGTGFFIDKGAYYKIDKTEIKSPEAVVLGDIHVGSIDPAVEIATDKMLKELKPKRVFLHDVFDGTSVNHHIKHALLTKAKMTTAQLSLEQELLMNKKYLEGMRKKHPDVKEWIIVRSNHDDFLDRYLQSGDYIHDPLNSKIAHKIALKKLESKAMGFEYGLEILGFKKNKFKFLHINDSYKIAGIECGNHGHQGLNGARSTSNSSLEIGYGAGVFGHSHTAGILRDVFRTGTSTYLRLDYNFGASSWTQTHCSVYGNGSRQLHNIFSKDWK